MKKTLILFSAVCLLAGCYDDYLRDYDYSAVFSAYQYDLRTFVYGEEDLELGFTAALGGVLENTRDRSVNVEIDNSLLTADLSSFDEKGETASFTALDGLCGTGGLGKVSQDYVSKEVSAAGLTALTPLPESYYTTTDYSNLKIRKGFFTAELNLTPSEALMKDPKAVKPYYALAFHILTADADQVPGPMSFQIMAIKVENTCFGNWYHGGRCIVGDTEKYNYEIVIPQADSKVYTLTTEAYNVVTTNKMGEENGSLRLTFNEDNTIKVEDAKGNYDIKPIDGVPSWFNGAKLIQDREIYLNYWYIDENGAKVTVNDYLQFRDRTRDGIREWRSENE